MKHLSVISIFQYIDNTISQKKRDEVEHHLSMCAMCKQELEFQRLMEQKIKTEPSIYFTANFTETIMTKIMSNEVAFDWRRVLVPAVLGIGMTGLFFSVLFITYLADVSLFGYVSMQIFLTLKTILIAISEVSKYYVSIFIFFVALIMLKFFQVQLQPV